MLLNVQYAGSRNVASFGEVATALAGLGWKKKESSYVVLEDEKRGFVQVAHYRKGQYIAEWRTPHAGRLLRAQTKRTSGKTIDRPRRKTSQFSIYHADILKLEDGMDILLMFWLNNQKPRRYYWRDLTPNLKRYLKLKASGKIR